MKKVWLVLALLTCCSSVVWADPVIFSAKLSAITFSNSSNAIVISTSAGDGTLGELGVDSFVDNGDGTFGISMSMSGNFGALPRFGLNSINVSGSAIGMLSPIGQTTSFTLPSSLVLTLSYLDPTCQSQNPFNCNLLFTSQTLASTFTFDLLRFTIAGVPGTFTSVQNAQIYYPAVPEPMTLVLVGTGLLLGRRKFKK